MSNSKGCNWISQCDENRWVSSLLIPGTHDTMTADCDQRYYKTQTLSLAEQLACGVRFLDIRLRREMVAAHREWISEITAEMIFEECRKFLAENPGEFILMRVQNANEKKDDYPEYGEALQKMVKKYPDLFYQWPSENLSWAKIKDIKGKVVALECAPNHYKFTHIDGKRWATNWHENEYIHLQDLWDGPKAEVKCDAIADHMTAGVERADEVLGLNHISATNGELGFPNAYADILNPYTVKLIKENAHKKLQGVQIYDFVTPEIAEVTYEVNFK